MLFKLLMAPITAPVAGFRFVLNQLATMADQENDSPERLREQLLLLQLRLEEHEISEEQYKAEEDIIIAQLRRAREKQRTGGGERPGTQERG